MPSTSLFLLFPLVALSPVLTKNSFISFYVPSIPLISSSLPFSVPSIPFSRPACDAADLSPQVRAERDVLPRVHASRVRPPRRAGVRQAACVGVPL